MAEVLTQIEHDPLVVHTSPALEMDDAQFFEFCRINHDLRIERTAKGDLVIMPPAGGSSGLGNARLTYVFSEWAHREGRGRVFDSSTGFKLPNGATRSPDVSWVRNERIMRLTDEEFEKFLPLCPDFVLELHSPSDPLRGVKDKMEEYMANGARLGWLLDPVGKQVHVYRSGRPPEILDQPSQISGAPVLKGFVLDVPQIWGVMERKGDERRKSVKS
ncbi:MAG: Uma2 family endonuclease [Verrucomicrobiales bacterium]|nr:Uma2 family endonuclease [Verrucomicrobiales bacterium]